MTSDIPTRLLGGIRVIVATRAAFAQSMVDDWHRCQSAKGSWRPKLSFSANGELLSRNARDPDLALLLDDADTIDADGQPMVLFSRFWPGRPLPERIATTDFFHDAARAAEAAGMRFYLLGGTQAVAEKAAAEVHRLYPRLAIAGYRNGYFDESERDGVIAAIQAARPDVVWVGMGTPRQHVFSVYARDRLSGVTWIKTCGGLFDFIAGRHSRAPGWMQAAGLEWLYRLALEPKRLLRRYLTTNFHALYLLFTRSERH